MAKSKSFYLGEMRAAWDRAIANARCRPLSDAVVRKLQSHAAHDLHDTVAALCETPATVKSNGKRRTWPDDEPAWAAWARWYPDYVAVELERVLPDIVAITGLDKDAVRRELDRVAKAAVNRVAVAHRVVDALDKKTLTPDELARSIYPEPKAHKARRGLRRVVEILDGLGVVGLQRCRDGVQRWALWRGLWSEDMDALASG